MAIEPFTIRLGDDLLADLRSRIRATRWPDRAPGEPWSQGTDDAYLRQILDHWADGFDWRARERELNAYEQVRVTLDGVKVHCVHAKAPGGSGVPLILTHGWPSGFVEYLALVPLLTDPAAHGIDGPAFDLVIPSLPGYGFSERPARTGVNRRYVADLWRQLMGELGYDRYGVGGADFGSGVATHIALDEPDRVIGVHLTTLELSPYTGPGSAPLSEAEQAYVAASQRWSDTERGYSAVQSTKPQTLGYGLTDSPAGLAAWLLEKWRSWSDSKGDLDQRFSRDFLLTMLTIYWATRTITPSMRDYFDNRWLGARLGPDDIVRVPTAIALFDNHFVPEGEAPREWYERLYEDVRRFTPMPRGGHFAAAEEPELVARDIAAFFAPLTSPTP